MKPKRRRHPRGSAPAWRNPAWLGIALIALSVGVSIIMIVVSAFRPLSPLESILFQLVISSVGLFGSFVFGRTFAMEAARDVIRPHVRSAFRRIRSLSHSLSRLSTRIETMQDENPDHRLELIHAVINEQAAASQDALDDWRDVAPDDVADIADMDAAPDDIDDSGEESGALDWRV